MNKLPKMWYFLKLCTTYSDLMVLIRNVILSFFLVNIKLCPHQVAPPVKIMPRPFFHECGIDHAILYFMGGSHIGIDNIFRH